MSTNATNQGQVVAKARNGRVSTTVWENPSNRGGSYRTVSVQRGHNKGSRQAPNWVNYEISYMSRRECEQLIAQLQASLQFLPETNMEVNVEVNKDVMQTA